MATGRTAGQKVADAKAAFEILREAVTDDSVRAMSDSVNKAMADAAASGNAALYEEWVRAGITITRLVSANDRAALIAAALITQSGVSRPNLDVIEEGTE